MQIQTCRPLYHWRGLKCLIKKFPFCKETRVKDITTNPSHETRPMTRPRYHIRDTLKNPKLLTVIIDTESPDVKSTNASVTVLKKSPLPVTSPNKSSGTLIHCPCRRDGQYLDHSGHHRVVRQVGGQGPSIRDTRRRSDQFLSPSCDHSS